MSAPETILDGRVTLHCGDSREVLRAMPDASVHAVACDPPYALVSISRRFGREGAAPAKDYSGARPGATGAYARASAGFMGQGWDTGETAFAVEFWAEVLRVLKPGGHVVAFGGTRSFHRLACAIEDAGFEIRDYLMWLYGSGFPKSHDVAKGIDRHNGDERPVIGRERLSNDIRGGALLDAARDGLRPGFDRDITSAASAASAAWEGWGTALKPAWEPIILARKPLAGTVAETVLTHGTGGLNIDGCRIEGEGWAPSGEALGGPSIHDYGDGLNNAGRSGSHSLGRWPANVVHDGSPEVVWGFPNTVSTPPGNITPSPSTADVFGAFSGRSLVGHTDSGSAARFYYSAKADADDRLGSKHPTVKPVDLMQWLVRLVTPPGGVVLDPFAGTGTTGEAAWREGFSAILIEREPEYQADIRRRMALCLAGPAERKRESVKARGLVPANDHGPLFGGIDEAQGGAGRSTAPSQETDDRPDHRPDRPQKMSEGAA